MAEGRTTVQMQKIMDYLEGTHAHPNAETIYGAVKKEVPSITLATVYRNLNKLAGQGTILKLEVNGEFRFDAESGLHQHCVCRNCGDIFDVFQEEISEYAMGKIKAKNFKPSSVTVIFYGTCRKCGKK